jgi:hypothetical protein
MWDYKSHLNLDGHSDMWQGPVARGRENIGNWVNSYLRDNNNKKLFPMDAAFVESCLCRAIAVKSDRMHIGFYVRYLKSFGITQ